MLRDDVRETHCRGEGLLMTGDQQRPLGRMTFEFPPTGGKKPDTGRSRGEAGKSASGRRNSPWGYLEERAWTAGGRKKQQV